MKLLLIKEILSKVILTDLIFWHVLKFGFQSIATFFLRRYHIIRQDVSSNELGEVLFAIRETMPFKRFESVFSNCETLKTSGYCFSVFSNSIIIVSIYRHPGRDKCDFGRALAFCHLLLTSLLAILMLIM